MRGRVQSTACLLWMFANGAGSGQSIGPVRTAEQPYPEAMVELELELPRAQQMGTPKPINLPRLDRRSPESVPPLRVPLGSHNLSRGRPVNASDAFPTVGELDMVTDGDKAGQDGSYVELGPGKQWVQIDLGATNEIFAVVLWFFHGEQRAIHDVVVRVSNDPQFSDGGTVLFNNDHDNSSGFGAGKDLAYLETHRGKVIDAKGTPGRYLRIHTNGNTTDEMNRFTEAEVFGRSYLIELALQLPKPDWDNQGPVPIKLPNLEPIEKEHARLSVPRDVQNVSLGKPVRLSDTDLLGGTPGKVTDGDKGSEDGSYLDLGPGKQWVQVDLGQVYEIFAIATWFHQGRPRAYLDVVVRASDDPAFERGVIELFNNDHDNSSGCGIGQDPAYVESYHGRVIDAKAVRTRFVRVQTNGNTLDGHNHFAEVEVYGRAVK